MHAQPKFAQLALALLLFAGCDPDTDETAQDSAPPDTTDTPGTTDTALTAETVPLGGECAMDVDYGGFVVEAREDYALVDGGVTDGVVPSSVLEELGASEHCQLLRQNNPFCKPSCESDEVCDFDGECIPYPLGQDLGTVSVLGLLDEVVMEALQPGNVYFETSLSNPPFEADALIELSMPAGTYGPAQLYGVGVETLVPDKGLHELVSGQDLTLSWAPPESELQRAEVALKISIDEHGLTPAKLLCAFPDTGEGVVPSSLIDQLINQGVTGFPAGELSRRTVDQHAAASGCMDFFVSSPREISVSVPGYTPCTDDSDCPKGQECNEEMEICE